MKVITLQPAEWDFRAIEELALEPATLYEYARSSEAIRNYFCRWLDEKAKGRTMRDRLRHAILNKETATADKISRPMMRDAATRMIDGTLFSISELIAKGCVDFPEPWGQLPVNVTRWERSAFRCRPLANELPHLVKIATKQDTYIENADMWLRAAAANKFAFEIPWEGVTRKMIVRDFERWLTNEIKNHPEKKAKGRASQLPIERLKWLAAYRLKMSGAKFADIAAHLDRYSNAPCPVGKKILSDEILPNYSDEASFLRAVANAKKHLRRLEAETCR